MNDPSTGLVHTRRADIFVSVVTVLDSNSTGAGSFVRELHAHVAELYANYEIVLVDNGVAAGVLTDLRDLLSELPCIRIERLSRPKSIDIAYFAGLEAAIGDFVVTISSNGDPVDEIRVIVETLRSGTDVVQGESREALERSRVTTFGRRLFYWYNRRYLDIDIPSRATYFMGMTRRAVNSLTASSRSHRYVRHLVREIGFRVQRHHYTPVQGRARPRGLTAGYRDAVEMITSYSTHPLRVVTLLGVAAAFVNLLYAFYVVGVRLIAAEVAEGWASTSLQLSSMFFVICLILATLSEYVARILTETRREPSYFVVEELESETLIADLERRNVSD